MFQFVSLNSFLAYGQLPPSYLLLNAVVVVATQQLLTEDKILHVFLIRIFRHWVCLLPLFHP